MIISVNSYLSFADIGLFEKLEQSTKWIPQFELIERIKKEEKKVREDAVSAEKEKTEKKLNTQFVKNARKKGLSTEIIAELTGLTKGEIDNIK
jgi:DNA repair protein RadC